MQTSLIRIPLSPPPPKQLRKQRQHDHHYHTIEQLSITQLMSVAIPLQFHSSLQLSNIDAPFCSHPYIYIPIQNYIIIREGAHDINLGSIAVQQCGEKKGGGRPPTCFGLFRFCCFFFFFFKMQKSPVRCQELSSAIGVSIRVRVYTCMQKMENRRITIQTKQHASSLSLSLRRRSESLNSNKKKKKSYHARIQLLSPSPSVSIFAAPQKSSPLPASPSSTDLSLRESSKNERRRKSRRQCRSCSTTTKKKKIVVYA